ncbi:MAG: hypothetical protein H7Z14_05445 [Anaerolineae bacterium]|nr:hypothetical protein [Phycisphaerae bacterium]
MKRVKLRALHDGRKLTDTVAQLLRAGLDAATPSIIGKHARVVIKKDRRTGAPVIQCPPDAPARRMTAQQLRELEIESQEREDLERLS